MHRKALIITFLAFISAGFVFWDMNHTPSTMITSNTETKAEKKEIIPNPEFSSINGHSFTLHQFKGKTIILNFWATWCAPCIAEFPQLLELAELKQDKIILIAMSVDEDPSVIPGFFKKFPTFVREKINLDNVIIAHDPGKKISQDLFQSVKYPETFIITPNLTIKEKIAGMTDWTSDEILRLIQ